METEKDNVVLFPTWQKELEINSLQLLQASKYQEALPLLNELLAYDKYNHEIIVGKIVCLIELNRADEAQSLCEELLMNKDQHYYQYVHLYLTILFQTNQYQLLMDQVNDELNDAAIPAEIAEQFREFSMMGQQMRQDQIREQTAENMAAFTEEVTSKNFPRQWQLIENLRKMNADVPPEMVDYLVDKTIHPVIKTVILKWLKDQGMSEPVTVHKLDAEQTIQPQHLLKVRKHQVYKQVLFLLRELEHENPSLFIMLEQLLYRYLYVRYPIMPKEAESVAIAKALRHIGETYLHMNQAVDSSEEIEKYIEEINICETLYLSVIEE